MHHPSNHVEPGCRKISRRDEGPDCPFGEPITTPHCVAALTAPWPFHMDVSPPKETADQRFFWHCLNRHKQPKRRGPNHVQSPDAAPANQPRSSYDEGRCVRGGCGRARHRSRSGHPGCFALSARDTNCAQRIGQSLRIAKLMALIRVTCRSCRAKTSGRLSSMRQASAPRGRDPAPVQTLSVNSATVASPGRAAPSAATGPR